MSESWTVRRLVAWIQADFERRGIDSARLEADLIVAHVLSLKRIALFMDLDRPVIASELAKTRELVERRRAHEPMAYLLGEREFYGRAFEVNRSVLIPRPDTELLVEQAVAFLRGGAPPGPVLDLCVGSGAVAVSVAAEVQDRFVVATDLSGEALTVARRNGERHGVSARVAFRSGDLFYPVAPGEQFACITVNPPYIGADEMAGLAPDVRDFEPRLALCPGADALLFYRRLAREAPTYLSPGGALFAEVGFSQAAAVERLWTEAGGFERVTRHRDLNGIERVVAAYVGGA